MTPEEQSAKNGDRIHTNTKITIAGFALTLLAAAIGFGVVKGTVTTEVKQLRESQTRIEARQIETDRAVARIEAAHEELIRRVDRIGRGRGEQ